ncbi:hypothetical protein [Mycolicibacterium sp. HS_4_1]
MTDTKQVFVSQLEAELTVKLGPRERDWGSFPDESTPLVTWLRDGTVFIHADQEKLSVRVPLVSDLTVSPEILEWISGRNSGQYAGHYWLRPGADEHHWQLVCEVKFPWDWMDQHLANVVLQTCVGLGTVLNRDVAPGFMEQFGGLRWWDESHTPEMMRAQTLALLD